MASSLKTCGCLSVGELRECGRLPSESRYARGPVAVLECIQEIPCNPCEDACPQGAIRIGDRITDLPGLDADICTGCGLCVARCPGLAIFIVDKTYSPDTAAVGFPHEYHPLPEKGQIVRAVDRRGDAVCDGKVVRIVNAAGFDRTPVVTLEIPKAFADEVRGMKRLPDKVEDENELHHERSCSTENGEGEDVVVCRCEEVTLAEIRKAIAEGATTLTGIKRRTRAGMGLCQGRTCSKIVGRMLAEATGATLPEILPDQVRPPIKPVEFSIYGVVDDT